MELETLRLRRCALIRVSGRIDSSNAHEFEAALNSGLNEGNGNLVVNLSGVSYMSSAALRALISAQKETKSRKLARGAVILTEVPDDVRDTFNLAALTGLFDFTDDEVLAVGSF